MHFLLTENQCLILLSCLLLSDGFYLLSFTLFFSGLLFVLTSSLTLSASFAAVCLFSLFSRGHCVWLPFPLRWMALTSTSLFAFLLSLVSMGTVPGCHGDSVGKVMLSHSEGLSWQQIRGARLAKAQDVIQLLVCQGGVNGSVLYFCFFFTPSYHCWVCLQVLFKTLVCPPSKICLLTRQPSLYLLPIWLRFSTRPPWWSYQERFTVFNPD